MKRTIHRALGLLLALLLVLTVLPLQAVRAEGGDEPTDDEYNAGSVGGVVGNGDTGSVSNVYNTGSVGGETVTVDPEPGSDEITVTPPDYTVTLSASPAEGGTVTGGGSYADGASITVTATAADGYTFVSWRENGSVVSTDASYTFTVTGDRTLMATFNFSVAVPVDPEPGSGDVTVTVDPDPDPADITVTIPSFTVTYKVTGGTWADGLTADKTETVDFGYSPATVPTGMLAASGYTGGAWDTDPSTATITEDATFTYSFTIDPDGTTVTVDPDPDPADITVTLQEYTVVLSASPSAGGRVTGAGTYSDGDTVTVSAVAYGGYRFDHWTRDNGSNIDDASFTFVIGENRTYEAVFVEDPTNVSSYTLVMPDSITVTPNAATTAFTVNVSALDLRPNASGNTPESFRVKVNAATLVNQSDTEKTISFKLCPYDTTVGTSDTLYFKFDSVQSKPGYIVITASQWNAATPGVYTGSMTYQSYYQYSNGDPEWLETVKSIPITLTIPEPAASYTVTVNNGTGSGEYAEGASVTITANEPETDKQFKEWTGVDELTFTSGSATTATATFTMPANAVTVTATYEAIPATTYAVTVNNGTGSGEFAEGDSVTITADEPEEGKQFKEWTGVDGLTFTSGSATTATATFTMPANAVTITATYEDIYPVTVNNGSGSGNYAEGASVTITANEPPEGQQFKAWTGVDGLTFTNGSATTATATFTMPANAVTVTATYEEIPVASYSVTVSVNDESMGTASADPTSGTDGTEVTLTATPNEGYRFKEWIVTSGGVTITDNKFTIGAADVVIQAIFEENKPAYTVSFDANVPANASTESTGSMEDQSFAYSERKALSANGYFLPGYNFEGWNTKADGTGTAYTNKAEVQGLSEDGGTVTLYAQWSGMPYTIEYWSNEAGSKKHVQTAYFDRPGKLDVYSDRAFGWDSDGKTLHGWHVQGSGSFLKDGDDFVNLCGAPDADGNVADPIIVADWVNNGQIVVTVTKDGVPQEGLSNHFKLLQGHIMYDTVSISYWNGRYVFSPMPGFDLPEGEYDLLFEANGYPSASAHITYGNAHSVSVVFDYYTVSLTKDPAYADFNEVEISGGEPVAGMSNTVVVRDGDMLSIKTTVASGYRFVGYTAVGVAPAWEGGDSTKAEQTIEVRGKVDITARVAPPIEYSVTVVGGTADKTEAKAGETVTITANDAEYGYAFVQWAQLEGVDFAQGDGFTTTFAMPAKDVTITAVFKEITLPAIPDKTYTGEEIKPTFGLFDVTLDGVDAVFPNRYALTYADNVNAGTATVTLTFKNSVTGEPDPRMGTKSTTFTILPAKLTITGVTAPNKEYDATTTATVDASSAIVSGLVSGYDVALAYTGAFEDANVGIDKPVTVTVNLSGEAAGNYEVMSVNSPTADITKRALTITVIEQTYDYDGQIHGESDTVYEDPAQIVEKVTVSGLQGDDALTCVILDGQARDPGVHTGQIKITGWMVGNLVTSANYEPTLEPGTLTIKGYKVTCAAVPEAGGAIYFFTTDQHDPATELVVPVGDTVTVSFRTEKGYKLTKLARQPDGGEEQTFGLDDPPYTFAMPAANVTVTGTFTPVEYKITFDTDSGDPLEPMTYTVVSTDALPTPTKTGSTFSGWKVTETAETSNWTKDATLPKGTALAANYGNVTLTAQWAVNIYTVTVTDDGNGTASANPASGPMSTEVTLTAEPSPGFRFKTWQVIKGGVTVTDEKFIIGTEDVEIKAVFEAVIYTVTVTDDGNGTGSADPVSGPMSTEVTLTATPDYGFQFKEWQIVAGNVTITDNKFTIGTEDVEVKAIFETVTYTVTDGADSSWRKDSGKTLVLTVKRSPNDETCFGHFTGVEIDGKAVTEYTAASGSTVVTLKPTALNKLSTGKHTITILFDDGKVQTTVKILAAYDSTTGTGDYRHPNLWLGLTMLSALGLAGLLVLERRRQRIGR